MPVTLLIIAITAVVSFMALNNRRLLDDLIFWPPAIQRQHAYYRFITHGFIHADFGHLFFNMLTLYFFGRVMEPFYASRLGVLGFALFYLVGIVVAILPSWFSHRNDANYRSLGASGAVSAVLFAFILLAPWSPIYFYFALRVPAILYAVGYVAYSIYMDKQGGDGINHSAHLWGGAYGVAVSLLIEPRLFSHFIGQLLHPGM